MSDYLPAFAVCLLYLAATVVLFITLRTSVGETTPAGSRNRMALWLATGALVLHTGLTYMRAGLPDALSLPFFTALSVTMLTIVLVQLLLSLVSPADYLGLAVYPLAAFGLLSSELSGGPARVLPQGLQIHVLLSITAYAFLALAAAQAVLVLIQRHYLNKHRPGGFIRALPALTSTESLLFTLIAVGFGLLSLSLLSGFVYLDDMFGQHLVHKTVLSCAAWLIFAVLLFGRWRFGWRGQRVVRWTLGGFCTLLIAFFGSKMVLELILQR